MIRYDLKCANGHAFDGWFASTEAFDKLRATGMVSCTICGATSVEKALMAPPALRAAQPAEAPGLRNASDPMEQAMAAIRRTVEENSDYVGENFATEARAMHEGTAPERSIWGEAKPNEARALIEDGISITPLPFLPTRKTN